MQRVQKLITFSPHLYTLLESKAEQLGISFPEYIRLLAVSDVRKEVEEIPIVDEETERQIGKSLQALKEGKYTDIRTEEELDVYLKSI